MEVVIISLVVLDGNEYTTFFFPAVVPLVEDLKLYHQAEPKCCGFNRVYTEQIGGQVNLKLRL
jgi:hypothetical protein